MASARQTAPRFRLRLAHKILFGYLVVTIILAAFAVGVLNYVRDLRQNMDSLIADQHRVIALSYEMEAAVAEMAAAHRGFLLTENNLYLIPYRERLDKLPGILKELGQRRESNMRQLVVVDQIDREIARWTEATDNQIAERIALSGAHETMSADLVQSDVTLFAVQNMMRAFREAESLAMADIVAEGNRLLVLLQWASLMLPLVVVVAGVLAVGTAVRSITRRMAMVEAAAEQISQGDLSGSELSVRGSDEAASLAHAFNLLRTNLRRLISQTREAALATKAAADYFIEASTGASDASNQIAEAMGALSGGAQDQARAVLEASRVIDELDRAVSQIATGAEQQANSMNGVSEQSRQMVVAIDSVAAQAQSVAGASRQGAALAEDGAKSVASTVAGMDQIRATSKAASQKVEELGQRSAEIGTLVGDIQAIASQTNLLALNAAIEAARAGEAGRGFAVVADSVRKLAEDSRAASQQIHSLSSAIRQETAGVVKAIMEGETQAEEGLTRAHEAARSLQEILEAVRSTASAATAIAAAAEQLRNQSTVVNSGILSATAVTQENTAATEQMAAGTDSAIQNLRTVSNLASSSAASAEQVSAATEELTATAQEVAKAARGLSDTAVRLTEAVSRFRL